MKRKMTKDELKAQNPDLYNEMIQAGIEQERDRVKAHLTMGKAADAMETAVKHIESGELMTQTVNAEYMAAGMNKQDVDSRQAEDDKLGDNQTSDTEEDGAAQFDAALKDNLGIQEAV